MTTPEPTIDPKLAALADAILIPPFPGTTAPAWLLRALENGLAGVTLFGPNVIGDTATLTATLRAAAPVEPVIAIDEEGGDVTRIAYATGSPYPGNAALGVVDDVALTHGVYAAIGGDLARLGINTDLAPCADVLAAGGSPVIGTRSFGSDPHLAARHVAAAVAGLQQAGVAACAKHFPGHGNTAADSHRVLATISGTLADLMAHDVPPFAAAVAAGSLAIMPGHLRVPELTGDLPASLSPEAVTGLLRGELGFDGVVICDALEMKAASATFGIPEAAVLAAVAGVDLICLGRDTDEAMYHAVRAAIADAVGSGRLPGARLEESAGRVAGLRSWLAQAREAAPASGADNEIGLLGARRALRRSGPVPAALVDPLIIEVEPEENIAAGRFTWGFEPWAATIRLDPAAGDGAAAHSVLAEAAGRPLVLAVRDAHGAIALVTEVLAARPDTVIVEMGVPAWTPPPGTAYLATYGASRACAQAAAEALGLALFPGPDSPGSRCPEPHFAHDMTTSRPLCPPAAPTYHPKRDVIMGAWWAKSKIWSSGGQSGGGLGGRVKHGTVPDGAGFEFRVPGWRGG
jgi:beta-N-acetylhexosaminidase